ncbi:MAG TPA: hypothetical protein VK601_19645, partial [Kofleriaceae bacterium]|nr:hypothetical protein [Kofleriaceae bacterium]
AADNALELRFATWGPRRIEASAADRYAIDAADRVELGAALDRAADQLFVGLGPDARRELRSRYGVERISASAGYHRRLTGAARITAESGVRHVAFFTGECCGDPSLDTRIAHGEAMAPPGYRDDYTAGFGRAALTIDTYRPAEDGGTTGYLQLRGAPGIAAGRSWIGYGAAIGGAIDLTGHHRRLSAQIALDFVDRITGDPVPFTEYPALGGELMPGFLAGWMTGRSTATAQLAYTWPLWLALHAQTRLAIGNAFDAHLAGAAPGVLRLSGDLALMSTAERDRGFELVLGLGTETFEQGAAITSLRVMLGSKRGL